MSFEPVNAELLQAAADSLGSDGLAAVRKIAVERFKQAGLPTIRDEDWRYTNLAPAADLSNRWLESFPTEDHPSASVPTPDVAERIDAHWIVIRNGRIDAASLDSVRESIGSGVSVSLLSETGGAPTLHTADALSSLNAALLPDALRIDVAAGVVVERPIGILIHDVADAASLMTQARIVVDAGENSRIAVVEAHWSSGGGEHFCNVVAEVGLQRGAHARYVKIQQRDEGHLQTTRMLATVGQDSVFDHASLDIGGLLVRNDVVLAIENPGAEANTSGIYLAHGAQHMDNHIHADHRVGPAVSRQNYRGVAAGRARCVFNGKAVVHEGADGTDAEQSNHNLLLSERAEIDTKPELEIYADDVKCAHGATVGQLDKTALFYLRSRGLDKDQAAQVLTRAFAGQIVSELPIDAARAYVEEIVDAKLDVLVEEDES